ncbi:MAG TPA: hypothetical protein VGH03_03580 [Caulobacteraceae bacterium]|jgi:hypothetical protein
MPKIIHLPIIAALAAGLCAPVAAAAQPADAIHVAADEVATVNGVKTACTGVGKAKREDPRWKDFAVRIEAASPEGDYLGGMTLNVADNKGTQVLSVTCGSPWLLMDLPPGAYKVTAWSGARGPRTIDVRASSGRQSRYVVAFPKPAPAS